MHLTKNKLIQKKKKSLRVHSLQVILYGCDLRNSTENLQYWYIIPQEVVWNSNQ